MSERSIANVKVFFGMLDFNLKFYISASKKDISFNMINSKTNNRVNQKLVDCITGETVDRKDLLKGYEHAKDDYILFTEEELTNLYDKNKDNTLEINEFIPIDNIDIVQIEKTYYVSPDKGMDKQYKVLFAVLNTSKKAAIGIWSNRGKQNMVAIRPYQNGLIVHQMFYLEEIREFDVKCDCRDVTQNELLYLTKLVNEFTNNKLDNSKYKNTYYDRFASHIMKRQDSEFSSKLKDQLETLGLSIPQQTKKRSSKKTA